ncbi:MAG: hypothetical protein WC473_01740 [Patescibacteria group bacterium]|jgi:ABC-type antimicrobial peptide transport system permease subunit
MFEDRRRLVLIILVIAIAIALAIVLWLVFGPKKTPENQQPGSTPQVETSGNAATFGLPAAPPERLEQENQYPIGLKQLAMSFAERYGSYSTDEPQKNIKDLESLMTPAMYKTALAQSPVIGASGFSGYSVKALSADLQNIKADSAAVLVKTQVSQTSGDGITPNVYYRNLQLNFIKFGTEWLVNQARWQ